MEHKIFTKKYIILALTGIVVFGIGVAIFFLNTKSHSRPSSYDVAHLEDDTIYVLSPKDQLTGIGLPYGILTFLLNPSNGKELRVSDEQGNWKYNFPKGIKEGAYTLTIVEQDPVASIAAIRNYNVKISNKSENSNWSIFNLFSK